jgi:hypothetical protein
MRSSLWRPRRPLLVTPNSRSVVTVPTSRGDTTLLADPHHTSRVVRLARAAVEPTCLRLIEKERARIDARQSLLTPSDTLPRICVRASQLRVEETNPRAGIRLSPSGRSKGPPAGPAPPGASRLPGIRASGPLSPAILPPRGLHQVCNPDLAFGAPSDTDLVTRTDELVTRTREDEAH